MKKTTKLFSPLFCSTAKHLVAFPLIVASLAISCQADEGMLLSANWNARNWRTTRPKTIPSQLFSPGKPSLIDGICRVNGCTGSFISQDGLIITNHHCAFEAIQNASTKDRDLLHDGFVARDRSAEIPSPSYTVRITQGYRDVSAQVLEAVKPR